MSVKSLGSRLRNSVMYSTIRAAGILFLLADLTFAASWTAITKPASAPTSLGTMILLSDGTVMIENGDNNQDWLRLEPDRKGDYVNGNFTKRAPMNIGRLYFASEVLPDGRIWVLGGEYTGPYSGRNDTNSGEIYDPVANSWTMIAPYPNVSGCGSEIVVSDGKLVKGKTNVKKIFSTFGMQQGWTVTGTGIPSGATIVSVDSDSEVTISAAATTSGTSTQLTFTGNAVSCFGATPSILLPGGKKILAGELVGNLTHIYDVATDAWSLGATKFYNDRSDEEGWAKLDDEKVVTYDIGQSIAQNAGYAEIYDPKTTMWTGISPSDGTAKGSLPLLSSDALGNELGPELRLQDGRMLLTGANQHTALYTPSTNTWAAGPDMLSNLSNAFGSINNAFFGADDAPAGELPNGHVIVSVDAGPNPVATTGDTTSDSAIVVNIPSTAGLQAGWSVAQTSVIPGGTTIKSVDSAIQVTLSQNASSTSTGTSLKFGGTFSSPTVLLDFDPKAGTMSAVSPALSDSTLVFTAAFQTRMLILPTGQLLFDDSQNLFVYTPDGSADPSLVPVVDKVDYQGGGVFKLSGKKLNGQSAGSTFGDDVETDENFPVVRLVNSKGDVYYCTSTGWDTTRVGDGAVTVNFTLNSKLNTPDDYVLYVSGAGLNSSPFPITITQAQIKGK